MKKFIALALTLAMMVSCLVFTASADASGVVVELQGPTSVAAGDTFQVKVRVTDPNCRVGGVQAILDVTGAEFVSIEANPDLNDWNNTDDVNTIYKVAENDVTFAALNSLEASSYDTRLWFKANYKVAEGAENVTVALENVKVADKTANLVTDFAEKEVNATVVDPATDPVLTLERMGLRYNSADKYNVGKSAIVVGADLANFDKTKVTEVGVVFLPTALLGGKELTRTTPDAIVASIDSDDADFEQVFNSDKFNGVLNFGFDTNEKALRFLGTKVSARFFYVVDGKTYYSDNTPEDKYIQNGVGSKAALNHIVDRADNVETAVEGSTYTKADYDAARNALDTNTDDNWQTNRQTVFTFFVDNKELY